MRAAFRQRQPEEEEESAFISMTDMTVSFLFIVMIMLAFFATQIAPGETVPKQLLDQLDLAERNVALQRRLDLLQTELNQTREALRLSSEDSLPASALELQAEIDSLHGMIEHAIRENPIERYNRTVSTELGALLVAIKNQIGAVDANIGVSISDANDALHFTGDGLFGSGARTPSPLGSNRMRIIAGIIDEEIGCFTFGGPVEVQADCNSAGIVIEAIQVEGHTDTDADDLYNMGLSADRAAEVFNVMVSERPSLLDYLNLRRQPVLSVAGYGEGRTIAVETLPGGKDSNRRIDIRFIMYAPVDEASVPLGVDDLPRVRELITRERE